MGEWRRRWPHLALALLIVTGLTFSLSVNRIDPSLEAIRAAGKLIVVTRNSPTTYFLGRDGTPQGFEVDLVESFAASLGVDVVFRAVDSLPKLFSILEDGEAHIAAAGLTITPERQEKFRFTTPYMRVAQIVVCRKGGAHPTNAEGLAGLRLAVTRESSYAEALQAAAKDIPGVDWDSPDLGPESLMQKVWERDLDCTIADDPIFQVTRRYYPELVKAFALTPEEPIAWALSPDATELGDALDRWFAHSGTAREIDRLTAANFGFFPAFDYVELSHLRRAIKELLPRFERDLRTAGRRNSIPWRLLAAMGYQESKWNPDAVSPTGVRGFMMLTQATAKRVGVSNRLNAKESIWGGARYLSDILSRLPAEITGDDRYWFALAAYNMGMGHMYDARMLAEQKGLNKNLWVDVKQVLKFLSDEKVYPSLPNGYARGYEARRYVEHVRTYWYVLKEQR